MFPRIDAGAGTGYWAALLRARGVRVAPSDVAPFGTPEAERGYTAITGVGAAPMFCLVRTADAAAAAAAAHPRAALLLCWPPWEDDAEDETPGGDAAAERAAAPEDAAASDNDTTAKACDAARAARLRRERMGADALAAFRGDTVLYVGEFDGARGTAGELTGGARLHGALLSGWQLAHAPLPLGERWRTHWYGFDEAQDFLTIWHRRRGAEGGGGDALPPVSDDDAAAAAADADDAVALPPVLEEATWNLRVNIFKRHWCESCAAVHASVPRAHPALLCVSLLCVVRCRLSDG
jgi:hypothetical protein